VAAVGQEVEVLCHSVGLVVVGAQLAMQTKEPRKEQMTVRNQVGEVVHQASLRKPKHVDGR
jgi:hypothetical protein